MFVCREDMLRHVGDEAHPQFHYNPYPRPQFTENFEDFVYPPAPLPFSRVARPVGHGHTQHRPGAATVTAAPPSFVRPDEQQRTAWQKYIDGALDHHVSFMMWPATDKASEVERYNVQGVNRLKKANFRMGLTPVFAGQVESCNVHLFSVCVRELLSRLEGKPFTDDVFVTMVGKKADPNKFGATVWTTAQAAQILKYDQRCRCAIRVTPRGFYVASSTEERQRIAGLDRFPNSEACHGFPARSVRFEESLLGKVNGN